MRYSVAVIALAALGAQAMPQDYVKPITQISDGQIQAPPASAPPAAPSDVYPPVQPITQISDGQVQAPPASPPPAEPTGEVPAPPAEETPTISVPPVEVPTETPTVEVPVTEAPPVVEVPIPSVPAVNTSTVAVPSFAPNSTFATGVPSTTEGPEESATETSPGVPEATGAAVANMASFGGLALAVAAMVLV